MTPQRNTKAYMSMAGLSGADFHRPTQPSTAGETLLRRRRADCTLSAWTPSYPTMELPPVEPS